MRIILLVLGAVLLMAQAAPNPNANVPTGHVPLAAPSGNTDGGTLGTIASQNDNAVALTGGTINNATESGAKINSVSIQTQGNPLVGNAAPPLPLLDSALPCGDLGGGSAADFAGGVVRLRTGVTTPIKARKKVSSVYTTQDFMFVNSGAGNIVDFAALQAWGAGRDANTNIEIALYNQCSLTTPNVADFISTSQQGPQLGDLKGTMAGAPTYDTVNALASSSMQGLTLPAAVTPSMDAWSYFMVGRMVSSMSSGFVNLVEFLNSGGGTPRRTVYIGSGGNTPGDGFGTCDNPPGVCRHVGAVTQSGVYGITSGASLYTFYNNGTSLGTGAKSTYGFNVTSGTLRASSTNTGTGGNQAVADIILSRIASAGDIAAIQAWAQFYTGMTATVLDTLALLGESNMQCVGATTSGCLPLQIEQCLARPMRVYNLSTSGYTFANMQSNTARLPTSNSAYRNIATTFGGYNDMVAGGLTVAQTLTAYESLNNAAGGAGYYVVATSGWKTNASLSQANQTNLYGGAIRQTPVATLNATALADTWSLPDVGYGSTAGSPWLQGGNLHFQPLGSQIEAQAICQEVNSLNAH